MDSPKLSDFGITERDALEHLEYIKGLLLEDISNGNHDVCLCEKSWKVDGSIFAWFEVYVLWSNINNGPWYHMFTFKPVNPNKSGGFYHWPLGDTESRLKWLDKHILIYKKKIDDNDRD